MWHVEVLEDACTFISRGISPKYIDEGGVLVLNQKCVRNHSIDYSLARRHDIDKKNVKPERFIKKGDVLVNSTGQGTLGRVAQVRDEPPELATVDSHVTIVRPNLGKFYLDYFGYALIRIEDELKKAGQGTSGQTELAKTRIQKEFFASYPTDKTEQKRIVAKLDATFAEIDRAVEIQEKTSVLISRAQKKLASSIFAGKQHDTSLWRRTVLGDVCTATQGVQIPKSKQTSTYQDGFRRYLYISDFRHEKSMKYVEDKYPKKIVTADDLIMSNTGSQGEVFRGVEGILSNNLFKIGVNKEVISADYLFNFLNSDVFIEYQNERTRGTTQPHMGHKNFLSTPILLPPLSVQNEVVTKLNAVNKMFECLAKKNYRKNEQIFNLKSAFLAQELQPPQSEAA